MLEQVPFRWVQTLYRGMRRELFTKPRPTGRYLVVDADVDVVRALGHRSYAPNWEFSYNYRGEDVNLAQVVFDGTEQYPDIDWWQTHVRGWVHDDGRTWLSAHYEAEPTEHPKPHLDGITPELRDGMMNLEYALEDRNVDVTSEVWDG